MQTVRILTGAVAIALASASLPAFSDAGRLVVHDSITRTEYDGSNDDLLSAGLNHDGLKSTAAAPGFGDALNPTPAELRRRAFYNNYRAIVDVAEAGGFGVLWGPKLAPTFDGIQQGLIPGVEYKGYLRVPDGDAGHVNNIPAAVQIPRHFSPEKPCIVAAMPSGSRSLYGAIAIAEWALFKGCAVALPGKGTDTGFHLLGPEAANFAVDNLDGIYDRADLIGQNAQFAVKPSPALDAYVASENGKYRVATKHAHSQINPERLWGQFGLAGIEFAFWALNEEFERKGGKRFDRKNTLVIATGASNGGGMALRALEDDDKGLIDGLVVTEPSIQPEDGRFVIRFGDDPPFDPAGRTIYDSMSLMSVYAACAALAPSLPLAAAPLFPSLNIDPLGGPAGSRTARCDLLKQKGLVTGDTTNEHAESALAKIRAHGYAEAQYWGLPSHEALNLWRSLTPTYASAYGRFPIQDNLCKVSFAATDGAGKPTPMTAANAKKLFADSSGVPATGGINLVADWVAGGIAENLVTSPSTGRQDLNLDSALCFRALQDGPGPDASARDWLNFAQVRFGTRQVQTNARVHGRPAIVIHGRQDALVFPNLHSRAYYALNQEREGRKSRMSYIEVTPGQHFDAFISSFFLGPAGAQFAPLHYYFVVAMDAMYAHLTSGTALPPSQVVRPTPRGLTPYTPADAGTRLPNPSNAPGSNAIRFDHGVLTIPE